MKKLIRSLIVLSSILCILFVSACSSGFDEEKAIDDSKEQLESFFTVYNNRDVIAPMDKDELKQAVRDSFSDFFTKEYLNMIEKEIDEMVIDRMIINFKSPTVFFMEDNSTDETVRFNQYSFSEDQTFKADPEKQTVTVTLVGTGIPQNMFVQVTMKEEGDKWKIDSVEKI